MGFSLDTTRGGVEPAGLSPTTTATAQDLLGGARNAPLALFLRLGLGHAPPHACALRCLPLRILYESKRGLALGFTGKLRMKAESLVSPGPLPTGRHRTPRQLYPRAQANPGPAPVLPA